MGYKDFIVVIAALVTGLFTILGFIVSGMINRWQRREKLKTILFGKKLDIYHRLVGNTADNLTYMIANESDEGLAHNLSIRSGDLIRYITDNHLFITDQVADIASKFAEIMINKEKEFEVIKDTLGSMHRKLRVTCKKELGLHTLEKDMAALQ